MPVCRALDGDGPPTFAQWLGSLCDAFPGRLPSEVYREWRQLPAGFLEEVMEARVFASIKAAIDRGSDRKHLPQHPMTQVVLDVIEAVALEEIETRRAARD